MCGICGIYYPDGTRTPDRRVLEAMTSRLRHRGPDGSGVHVDGAVGLGATRLAIIDLSPRASQPMTIDGGACAISFNGEVYNYRELRSELEREGVRFHTNSDTEVLLRLYRRRGTKCLDALRGMFAFAIWDRGLQQLFLARDRAGEKPVVYHHRNGLFAFASEIKALLAVPGVPREIDPLGLHYGFHYVTVPAPYSAFRHIRKLRPAEYLIVSSAGVRSERYWMPRTDRSRMITDRREAAYEVRRCLQETVSIMNRSDVPVGATLSGGLDSSATVALTERDPASPLETFCVSYDRSERDREFAAARLVASRHKTKHHELLFGRDRLAAAVDAVRSYDEPFTTFVPLHAHALARLIGSRVKVALTGNGGDELFGGYGDHRFLVRLEARLPFWRSLGRAGLDRVAQLLPIASLRRSWDKYRRLGAFPLNRLAAELRLGAARTFCAGIYAPPLRSAVAGTDPLDLMVEAFDAFGGEGLLDGFLVQQLMVGSQHSIVHIPDISGMAHSLEYRSPFLDREMIGLACRIPGRFKVSPRLGDAGGKMVLREALAADLPREVLRMHKSGFGSQIPYHQWFLQDWEVYVRQRLTAPKFSETGLFDTAALLSAYDRARAGGPVPIDLLWGAVMVSQWVEEYF